jgi:hypothetical protein
MQFYIYRIERKGIGAKWSRGTCLAALQKRTGTHQTLKSSANGSSTMVPSTSKTQLLNATNMYIMNTKSERRSDSGNSGIRITEFGVVVGKIRWFEVLRAILLIFLGLGTSLELFCKNQGSDCETAGQRVDYPKV